MRTGIKKLMTAAAIGASLSVMIVAAPAQAAVPKLSSNIQRCNLFPHNGLGERLSSSDGGAMCAQVYVDVTLNVRRGPGPGFAFVHQLTAGRVYEFDCWTTGAAVDGDNIWLKLYPISGPEYVSDRYVYTGANVKTLLNRC